MEICSVQLWGSGGEKGQMSEWQLGIGSRRTRDGVMGGGGFVGGGKGVPLGMDRRLVYHFRCYPSHFHLNKCFE